MSAPDYSALGFINILVSLDGPVLVILMNRAKQRNSWIGSVPGELQKVFDLADKDDRVRVVILTSEHTAPAYCAGADISGGWNVLWDPEEEKEGHHAHRDSGGKTSLVIYRCRKITIAAVNGHAAGVGMTAMQLPFDFRFVWAGAKLTFPFVRRGIVPEGASLTFLYLLPRLIGQSRANSLLLTGATFTADSPIVAALYHQILPTREAVFPAALAFAKELAATTSQVSIAVAKGLIQHPGDSAEENHLYDSLAMRTLGGTADGEEGIRSFKEKREPKFSGTLSKDLGPWHPWWRDVNTTHRKAKL
ncbi:peroxisomal enoyl-CoA-hydratase [Mycena rosella]|uniref:Peroxisomal enoyl-CoA-hydratase n=1 Tax=Mycena rosella TaxID=1033263 RepID=A0AAD7M9Z1_MYCRO|nr:peroxisomal enoyl-CoA-hydratase [Mycena rosella]